MAPEVIKGDYDESCDVWSIGVLAFMLLSSSLPFFGKTRHEVVRKIMRGRYGFKGRRWKEVSPEAKEFVTSLLVHNVKNRPSCNDALADKWFGGGSNNKRGDNSDGSTGRIVSSAVMDRVQATIQTFAGYTKLKKLALYVIAHKSSADEVGFLQQLFQNRFDVEKDGIITLSEFKDALTVYDYSDDELETMFNAVDIDGCDNVAYSEFLAATIEAHGSIEEDRIAEAFDRLDNDDDGYITVSNLTDFLGDDISKEYIDTIIDEVDVSNDHRIDYDEFLGLWDGSFDEVLERNLQYVRQKRMVRESVGDDDVPVYEVGEGGEFLEDNEKLMNDDDDTNASSLESSSSSALPSGAGKYFFEQEKEKSMRGIWV